MIENKTDIIPEPALRRMPWYLSYVTMLRERNVEFVSSTQIARELKVDSSQIAKDLSFLDIKGKTRIGYEVSLLERKLKEFLGFSRRHKAVIVGVGSLGSALMQDSGLMRYGLEIVAGFDVDPKLTGTMVHGLPVYHIDELEERLAALGAGIGILTVPVEHAQEMTDRLIDAGCNAIWNFTPFRICAPHNVVISNTSIYAHLAVMYNRMA